MRDYLPELFFAALLAAAAAILVWLVLAIEEDEKRWQDYKADHNCIMVDKEQDDIILNPVYAPDGKSFTMQPTILPGKTIYKCDTGEIKR